MDPINMATKDAGFSLPWKILEDDAVKLTPFVIDKHASAYFEATKDHPETYEHMFMGPYDTEAQFVHEFVQGTLQSNPNSIGLAIIDKTSPPSTADPDGALAGLAGCTQASAQHQTVCIGYVIIMPQFRRSGIFSNVLALLLHYFLDTPAEGGLGLRRVEVITSKENQACVHAMQRLGLRFEGERRWHVIYTDANRKRKRGNGRIVPEHGKSSDPGRDTLNFAMCWDDWRDGGRETVKASMEAKKGRARLGRL